MNVSLGRWSIHHIVIASNEEFQQQMEKSLKKAEMNPTLSFTQELNCFCSSEGSSISAEELCLPAGALLHFLISVRAFPLTFLSSYY